MQARREHQIRLAAGRLGLKLVRDRLRAEVVENAYCLRGLLNAAFVVGRVPGGGFGLLHAQTGRGKTASWLTLAEVEQVLATWAEPAPKAWGEPPSIGSGPAYTAFRRQRPADPRRTKHARQPSGWLGQHDGTAAICSA
jgi:hypothetical protein